MPNYFIQQFCFMVDLHTHVGARKLDFSLWPDGQWQWTDVILHQMNYRYAENTLNYHTWLKFLKFQTDQRHVLKEETSGTLSWNYYNRNALMPEMRKHSSVTCQSVPLNHPCHPSSSHNCLSCQQHFSVNTGSQSKMIGFFSAHVASPCRFFFSV